MALLLVVLKHRKSVVSVLVAAEKSVVVSGVMVAGVYNCYKSVVLILAARLQ